MAIQRDGKILVTGQALQISKGVLNSDFALARYSADGRLDTTFGVGGKFTCDFFGSGDVVQAVAVQENGKIVAAGVTSKVTDPIIALARYKKNGQIDRSFGKRGKSSTKNLFLGTESKAFAVLVQQQDKFLVAGTANNSVTLVRYKKNGKLDKRFADQGKSITDFGGGSEAHAMAAQMDGKIIAAGSALNAGNANFALARYLFEATSR